MDTSTCYYVASINKANIWDEEQQTDGKAQHQASWCTCTCKKIGSKGKCLFYTLAAIVQAALLLKCGLFILRQISPHVLLPEICREANNSNDSTGSDQQYLFTMVAYSSLFIGRWIETLIIHIHIYKFFFSQSTITLDEFKKLCNKGLKKNYIITTLLVVLMIYMFTHSECIPLIGMMLEIQHGQDLNCKDYTYEHHVVYWLLDIIRYLNDVAIRILMVLATIVIGQLWCSKYETPNDTTKTVIGDLRCAKSKYDSTPTAKDTATKSESGNTSDSDDSAEKEPDSYIEYLQDRVATNEDHATRTKDYAKIGSKVERILEIFQTWFPIPWLLYFTSTSLDTDHILKAWKDGSSGEGHYDFSEISYMIYNFNQLSLLTIAFLCSKKMNTYHRNYFSRSRREQIKKFKTASRMAMASMNKIEKEEHFDFVPRVWGTSIKVPVESSLYIVTMLVGIFFTVCEALI